MASCVHAAELRRELRDWKRRVDGQLESILGEMAVVKNCIMQLYNVLLPGKFPLAQPASAPAPPPPLHGRAPPLAPQHAPSYQQVDTFSVHSFSHPS